MLDVEFSNVYTKFKLHFYQKVFSRIRDREAAIRTRTAGRYRQAMRLLGANPSASAKGFGEALDSLRDLLDRREDGPDV